jgi:hypothetical protein
MAGRSKIWRIGSTLFVIINVAGAIFAAAQGEMMHAATHAIILFAGLSAYAMWQTRQSNQRVIPGASEAAASLDHLQQTLDSIALEVERIGEAQRYEARLLNDRVEKSSQKKDQ